MGIAVVGDSKRSRREGEDLDLGVHSWWHVIVLGTIILTVQLGLGPSRHPCVRSTRPRDRVSRITTIGALQFRPQALFSVFLSVIRSVCQNDQGITL